MKKLGVALVGLGNYSTTELGPALDDASHCFLAGIVTGNPAKADKWKENYDILDDNIYDYENFDSIKDNPDIDIVYVVLPNAMHADFVIRAAKAGKHVICEKPMATSVEDCDRMIAACKEAGVLLSVGYQLRYEPHNLEMMRLGQDKVFGEVEHITAGYGMQHVDGWRLDKKMAGGGAVMDLGIYCVQAAQYTIGAKPISVIAQKEIKHNAEKFRLVEESARFKLEFPGNIIADCKCSYSEDMNMLLAKAEKGKFELSPAFDNNGIKGKSSDGEIKFATVNPQARQMDDFALAITNGRQTAVPGEMGREDIKVLQAIYRSMESGQRVLIG